MTVETTNSTISYTGNNSVTTFAYNFLTYSEDHLFIYLDDVEQTSGFSINGVGDESGGEVIFNIAPGDGVEIRIDRTVPETQLIEYQEYGPFKAKTNERGLDLGVMIAQQNAREIGRDSSKKMDKRTAALENNVVIFDDEGNSKDSGVTIDGVDVTATDRVIPFDTLDEAINETNPIKIFNGAALNLKERTTGNGGGAMWDVVLASSVTIPVGSPDYGEIVSCIGIPSLAMVLREGVFPIASQFGVKHDGSDQTLACQYLIDKYADIGIASKIQFDLGVVGITKLDFKDAKNITFIGVANQFTYDNFTNFDDVGTRFRGLASTVMFEFSQDDGTVSGEAFQCGLENLVVDGNAIAQRGVVLNGASWLYNCGITNTVDYGVIYANYTNSASVDRCGITRNLGTGMWIKGAQTTVFSVTNSTLRQNAGYGLILHNGSNGKFDTIVVEANSIGGVLCYKPQETGLFQNITFNNVHVEANGKLDPTHPDYNGNYQCVIDSAGKSPGNALTTVFRLFFDNCLWSVIGTPPPNDTRKFFKIDSASNIYFDTRNIYSDGDVVALSSVGTTTAPYFVQFGQTFENNNFVSLLSNSVSGSAIKHRKAGNGQKAGLVMDGGVMYGEGGRCFVYDKLLQSPDYPAAGTNITIPLGDAMKRWSILDSGSVVGMIISFRALSGTTTGTLTFRAGYSSTVNGGTATLFSGAEAIYTLGMGDTTRVSFGIDDHTFSAAANQVALEMQLEASADFQFGSGSEIYLQLITQQ